MSCHHLSGKIELSGPWSWADIVTDIVQTTTNIQFLLQWVHSLSLPLFLWAAWIRTPTTLRTVARLQEHILHAKHFKNTAQAQRVGPLHYFLLLTFSVTSFFCGCLNISIALTHGWQVWKHKMRQPWARFRLPLPQGRLELLQQEPDAQVTTYSANHKGRHGTTARS